MSNGAKTLIRNLNIVDVISGGITSEASLLISDGVIIHIGQINTCEDVRMVDARGSWAIPSLIDMHAHITFEGRSHHPLLNFHYNEDDNLSCIRGAQNLFEALQSGVCLIRDVGSKGEKSIILKTLVDSGKILGPELILSGEPLCVKNGHGFEFGKILKSYKNMENIFNVYLKLGCEWLKIMNGPELFEEDRLRLIVEVAHQLGMRVAVHAFTESGIAGAIRSGADTIEHSVVYNQELLEIAQEKQTQFIPTCYCSWISLHHDRFLKTMSQAEIDYLKRWYDFLKKNIPFHIKNAMPLAVGTDAGSAPCTFSDIVNEIKMLHYHGLSILDAVRAATLIPARILRREHKYGAIDVGKWANLILLKRNPLEDINALSEIIAIWYRGLDILNQLVPLHSQTCGEREGCFAPFSNNLSLQF